MYSNLKSVGNEQSEETERRAGEMHAMLHFARMEDILEAGLPEFLRAISRAACATSATASRTTFLLPPVEA